MSKNVFLKVGELSKAVLTIKMATIECEKTVKDDTIVGYVIVNSVFMLLWPFFCEICI